MALLHARQFSAIIGEDYSDLYIALLVEAHHAVVEQMGSDNEHRHIVDPSADK